MQNNKLPKSFKYLFWWTDYSQLDTTKNKQGIIVQTINYGDWEQWQYLINLYGRTRIKKIIENTPASVFRPSALKLATVVFDAKKIKYATRSDKIRAEKNI